MRKVARKVSRDRGSNHVQVRRQVGDPWYTVLYRQPARLWWAAAIPAGLAGLVAGYVKHDLATGLAVGLAGSLGALGAAWVRWQSDAKRNADRL